MLDWHITDNSKVVILEIPFTNWSDTFYWCLWSCFPFKGKVWNRMRPKVLVQNQRIRELISTQYRVHKLHRGNLCDGFWMLINSLVGWFLLKVVCGEWLGEVVFVTVCTFLLLWSPCVPSCYCEVSVYLPVTVKSLLGDCPHDRPPLF